MYKTIYGQNNVEIYEVFGDHCVLVLEDGNPNVSEINLRALYEALKEYYEEPTE